MADLPNVGDLARVVRVCGCCDESRALLNHFVTVVEIVSPEVCLCGRCHKIHPAEEIAITDRGIGFGRSALRRIPRLRELESIHIADELDGERPRERVSV